MEISDITLMRLTRDAEVELDDDPAADFRAAVKEQFGSAATNRWCALNSDRVPIPPSRRCFASGWTSPPRTSTTCRRRSTDTTLFELLALPIPALRDPDWTPLWPPSLDHAANAIFAAIPAGDLLVHHPYESFDATVEHFISSAADQTHRRFP